MFLRTQRSASKEQVQPTRMRTTLNEIEEAEKRRQEDMKKMMDQFHEDGRKIMSEMELLKEQEDQRNANFQKRLAAKKAEIKREKMELAQNVANLALALESTNQLLDNPYQLLGITEEERLAKKQIVNVLLERFKQVDVESINKLSLNDVREIAKNIAAIEKERQDLHSNIDSKKASDQSKPIIKKIEEDLKRSEERFGKKLDNLKSDDPEYLKEVELLKQEMARARVQFLQTIEPVAAQHTPV